MQSKPDSDSDKREWVVVRPKLTQALLVNPGMGIMSFQRLDGDPLSLGNTWDEQFSMDYRASPQPKVKSSSVAYFRTYWRAIEPEPKKYRWEVLDRVLEKANERGQRVVFRLMPYGDRSEKNSDVPNWYRKLTKEPFKKPEAYQNPKWRVDQTRRSYVQYYGRLIREFAKRYDGNPIIEFIDVSLSGPWGEGSGADKMSKSSLQNLFHTYTKGFRQTQLVVQPWDWKKLGLDLEKYPVGMRFDCLGDVGGFSKTWSHMYDLYPQVIIESGLKEAWKKRPVSLEVCWVMRTWKEKGWDIDYILNQALKWRVSTLNTKSSQIPRKWQGKLREFQKKMGYRLALRRFAYPKRLKQQGVFKFTSWWENLGVAPPYRDYTLALQFVRGQTKVSVPIPGETSKWLPGDILNNGSFILPKTLTTGKYEVFIGLLSPKTNQPEIQLAIDGRNNKGWYRLGLIEVTDEK